MKVLPSFRMLVAFVCVSAVVASPPLRAADTPKPAAPAKGKPIEPTMTRAELRQCMSQQDQIQTQADALLKQRKQLEGDSAELRRTGEALKESLTSLDRSNKEAVDGYNAQVAARDRAVEALEAQSNDFNGKVAANDALREGYAKACKGRKYDERDEAAIRSGK